MVGLFGDAAAEAVEDSADTAHQAENSPEKGAAEDVGHFRFGVRQQQDAPGDEIGADDDTSMAENEGGNAASAESQINERGSDKKGDKSRDGLGADKANKAEDNQGQAEGGGNAAGFHINSSSRMVIQ